MRQNVIFQEIHKIGDFTGKICDLVMISETNVSDALFSYCGCYCCCCYCCCYFCCALKTAK